MKIKKDLILREVAGETILIPYGKTVYDANGLFVLNELGAFLWGKLPEAESEDALLLAVLDEYEVGEDEARADLAEFLARLREMEIL